MIDMMKIKNEMKLLTAQIKDHKKVVRDSQYIYTWPEIMAEKKTLGEWGPKKEKSEFRWQMKRLWGKKSFEFTKLCVLKSLLTGKRHLSLNTRISCLPGLKSLTDEDLLDWVSSEKERFQK